MAEEVILRFDNVTFEYEERKPVLNEVSFSVRKGAKITLMGQNGAGKSTIFKLIQGELKPTKGNVFITNSATTGTASQMIHREDLHLTIQKYFEKAFESVPGNIKGQIQKVMDAVHLDVPLDRKIGELSGGQQARINQGGDQITAQLVGRAFELHKALKNDVKDAPGFASPDHVHIQT